MAAELSNRFQGLKVAGWRTPPFGEMSGAQDLDEVHAIRAAKPEIIWVGLSTPKQEYWMRDHAEEFPGSTLIGVGAAFDFYAGSVQRAPVWMQRSGLEWFYRLCSEPRRLWRRYLLLAPKFVLLLATTGAFRNSRS
jgi:N-acetylglucosaminyldiphosphoundecaprenol N-acetyl-beta-D-mannosaminyltransferase